MIFYSVLLSYAFVNILADNINDYIEEVNITNQLIETACQVYVPNAGLYGLEYTIKRILREDKYPMEQLNFMMAIPDYTNRSFSRYTRYQEKMQREIITAIGIDIPKAKQGDSLESLGDKRRKITGPTIKHLLYNVMLHATLGQEDDLSHKQKCHLIGLAMSTINPSNYIVTANIENNTTCVITDFNNNIKKYKQFEGKFWELELDHTKKVKLLDQLYQPDDLDQFIEFL
ncbi:uncharacterized protein LOC126835796 [Adelges cooleyi]|uniref:uncharacterized protein LOC126835796 n=1 Tax=Adelges cooleyi TaxID=133065 RepID=UPI0021806DFF|nr:uncharacterized protein LOC126835796 [Adelges cooleyi]